MKCTAICSTHGRPCRAHAKVDGLCGVHAPRAVEPEEMTDPEEHTDHANDLLVRAMNHADWGMVPGPIRHLIEYAWLELWRAAEPDPEELEG